MTIRFNALVPTDDAAAARARVESSALDWAAIFDRVVKPCWLSAAGDSRRPSE